MPIKQKQLILYAFVFAMLITIACSLLKKYGGISTRRRSYGNDGFKNHIVTSYFVSTSIFLYIKWLHQRGCKKINIVSLMVLGYHLLFLNTGRIGYITLLIYLSVYTWAHYRIGGLIYGWRTLCLIFLLAYHFSGIFRIRIFEFIHEIQLYLDGSSISSIGAQFDFVINGFKNYLAQPLFSHGLGSFGPNYVFYFGDTFSVMTDDPHNLYLNHM